MCDYTNVRSDGTSICHYEIQATPLDSIAQNYFRSSLPMELVVHLFKKEIIRQAFERIYPTGVGEDTYSIAFASIFAGSICYVPMCGYYYDHRNEHSIINTHGHDKNDWLPHQYNIERIS